MSALPPQGQKLLNQLRARVAVLPEIDRVGLYKTLDKLLAEYNLTGTTIDWWAGEVALGHPLHGEVLTEVFKGALRAVDQELEKLPRKDVTVGSVKTFRAETLTQMQVLRERVELLPPHVRVPLEERWRKRERSIRVMIDADGNPALAMPQTVEDEEELQEELARQLQDVEEELTKIQYQRNPAHVVALEQQLLAYRVNSEMLKFTETRQVALQRATIEALRTAVPYCWAPSCVEAVATAASLLPGASQPAEAPMGELLLTDAAGWWWFERPIPLKSVVGGEPVIALCWRREVRTHPTRILDALGGEVPLDGLPTSVSLTWFNAFIHEPVVFRGRRLLVPNPSLAWVWVDTVSVDQLEQDVQNRYRIMDLQQRSGAESAPADVCAASALWLSKFWLAATVWLEKRVVVARQSMAVPRQQGRQLARDHGLDRPPLVEVVYLRRPEPAPPSEAGGTGSRQYHVRWLVKEHIRRQWYPSLGRHQLTTVKAHEKGPAWAPLKSAVKVYAVNR